MLISIGNHASTVHVMQTSSLCETTNTYNQIILWSVYPSNTETIDLEKLIFVSNVVCVCSKSILGGVMDLIIYANI